MKQLYLLGSCLCFLLNGMAQSLYFPPTTGSTWDTLTPASQQYCAPQIDSLYTFLDSNQTKAFILLKDGKIVLEKYFGTQNVNSYWQWASAGKTITSFMVGVAQQEHHLSINDTSSKYLGAGWTSCTPAQEARITIRNQLTMTTGFDDGVPDNHCTQDTCFKYLADPGTRWAYHNSPYTILDSVIASATGQSLNAYTNQKLKQPTGMNGQFVMLNEDNVYFSNARSMARFGLLILNKGNWNGTALMTDTAYFRQMTNTSQNLNPSYGYLWWLNGKSSFMIPQSQMAFNGPLFPDAPADVIAAMGKDGQFLNVIPSSNMVWIRMGNAPDNSLVPFLLNNEIWKYVNRLRCSPEGVEAVEGINGISVAPNPTAGPIHVEVPVHDGIAEVFNMEGNRLIQMNFNSNTFQLETATWPTGIYQIKVTSDRDVFSGRIIR
ncbi:MAG: serine hydrolase [Chitinophagales bacterium]